MLTASRQDLASAMPRLLISLNLQAAHQLAESAEQIDNGHQLENRVIVQPQLPHRGSVYFQSVVAAVHCRHGDGDDLLR